MKLMDQERDELWWEIFLILAWLNWGGHNKAIFEGKQYRVEDTLTRVNMFLHSDEEERQAIKGAKNQCPQTWEPPVEGVYKLNTDVSIMEKKHYGLGGIIRDWAGDTIASFYNWREDLCSISEAKALALRRGIEIARDIGIKRLFVE